MGEKKEFVKNVFKFCIPSVFSALIGICVIPICSRLFSTEDYGKINLFYSIGNILMYFVLLGMDGAYIRYYYDLPKGVERKQIFLLAFWTSNSTLLVLLGGSLIFFSNSISQLLFGENNVLLIIMLALYVLGLSWLRLLNIDARMNKQVLLFNIQQILLIFSNRLSFVCIAGLSTKYNYSLIIITVSTLIVSIVFLIIQKKKTDLICNPIEKTMRNEIIKFALPLMPTTLMVWINNSIAKLVLSANENFSAVGVVSMGTSIANVFSLIPTAFCVYWSPYMYSNYRTKQKFIKEIHSYICLCSIIITIGIFGAQDLLYSFVGEAYNSSQKYFMLIMLTPIQMLLCETTGYGIMLGNKVKYNLIISVIAVIINYLVGFTLYSKLGDISVAIGIALSAIFQFIAKTVIAQKYYCSIENKYQTIIGTSMVLALCVINCFIYPYMILRFFISVAIIIISLVLYRKEIIASIHIIQHLFKR